MITLMVNGKPRGIDCSVDLATYINSFGIDVKHLAVGYNGEIIKQERYPNIILVDGDVLEIVRPVGGG